MGSNLTYVDVGTNVRTTKLQLGKQHTCIFTESRQVKCWGSNEWGYFGFGDFNN